MNKIVIAGRLCRDPELRTTGTGTEVCGFCVAVDRRMQKDKEKVADFIECTAWGKTGVFVSTWFKKGNGIVVIGRMESSKYKAQDGTPRTGWGVTVDEVEFPIGKSGGNETNHAEQTAPTAADFTDADVPEGELPF